MTERIFPNLTAILFGVCVCFAGISEAKPRESDFKVGDRVETDWGGKTLTGTVDSIDEHSGWLNLKLDDETRPVTKKPPSRVRHSASKKKSKTSPEGSVESNDTDESPFLTAEERAARRESRTWTDSTGKHKVEATLLNVEDGKVTLKRKDGKEFTLNLDRLSEEDQQFLADGSKSDSEEEPDGSEDAPDIEITKTDATQARTVNVAAESTWSYVPEEVADGRPTGGGRVSLGKKEFFDKVQDILFTTDSSKAMVVFSTHDQGSRVVVCDLKKQRVDSSGPFVAGRVPLAVSNDMQQIVASSTGRGFGKRDTLYLYDMQGTEPKVRFAWQPYADEQGHQRDVKWARFVGPENLLTLSEQGELVCWQVSDTIKPIYRLESAFHTMPCISPKGKYLATLVRSGIALIDVLAGQTVGHLPAADAMQGTLAFDPQGKQLALATHSGQLRVWDLITQKLTRDFEAKGSMGSSLQWADKDHVLIGGSLYNVPCRVADWQYSGIENATIDPRGKLWYIEGARGNDSPVLASGKVVNETVRTFEKKLKPEALLVITPGMKVAVDLQLGVMAQHHDEILRGVTKRFKAAGMTIDPSANVKFVISITPGETKKVMYRSFGRPFIPYSEHQFTEQKAEISYRIGTKTVWSRNSLVSPPHHIELKKDESIDQAIARSMQEFVSHMGSWWIPSYVAILPDNIKAGSSTAPPEA